MRKEKPRHQLSGGDPRRGGSTYRVDIVRENDAPVRSGVVEDFSVGALAQSDVSAEEEVDSRLAA